MRMKAKNLSKKFGKKFAVKNVDIELNKGEIVGFLGPNGAGKTTTFRMIIGFLRPNEGKIFLNEQDITDYPMHIRARMGIGYLPQEPSVFRNLTVAQNLLSILELRELNDKIQEKFTAEMEEFNLEPLKDRYGYSLSGGERRRVEIARALLTDPHFLLLDEPFTGVDPIVRADIQKMVKRLKNKGIGILVTDHNVRETLEITDRAYLIYEGEILLHGNAKELIDDPTARKLYLGEGFKI